MKIRPKSFHTLAFAVILSLTTACSQATPIVILVTPTQESSPTLQVAQRVTVTATTAVSPVIPSTPTFTSLPMLPTPMGPTLTFGPVTGSTPSLGSTPTGPTATFGAMVGPNTTPHVPTTPTGPTAVFGPVVGPNYTPPPTFTSGPPPTLPPANVTLPPLVTPGPSPTPSPILHSSLMGIQIHGYLKDDEWMRMLAYSKDLGMGWIKVQVQWKELEPSKGNFNELYSAMVLNVQRARLQGFRTMLSIAKAPGWARPSSVFETEDGPSDNPQDFADFVARFVHDTKPEFIDAIEIWNEPNLIREWRGKPLTGAEYMKYFSVAYAAIQNEQRAQLAAHRITVITAGPAPTGTSADGSSLNDRDWLQQLYTSGLLKYGSDVVVGAHPYGWANPPDANCCMAQSGVTGWYEHRSFYFRDTLDDYRKIMIRNNHAAGKLWVTEFGWATYDGLRRSDGNPASADPRSGWQTLISQGQQASYVLRAFHIAQQPPYYEYLGPMMLWNLNFGIIPRMIDDSREEAGFSLLDANWNPRPVYIALKNAAKQ
jgi:polysaccharide biosynthesis protein PslG